MTGYRKLMKKVLLVLMFILCLGVSQAQAADFSKYSNDYKVKAALEVLENIGSNDVFARLNQNKMKIMFYDLSSIDYSYSNHYAVASTDENGENYILINEKFKNSPKEAIACLIAHESVHVLPKATLEEEVRATTTEVQTWLKVADRVSNSNDKLVQREMKLADNYRLSTPSNNTIANAIASNSFYRNQFGL